LMAASPDPIAETDLYRYSQTFLELTQGEIVEEAVLVIDRGGRKEDSISEIGDRGKRLQDVPTDQESGDSHSVAEEVVGDADDLNLDLLAGGGELAPQLRFEQRPEERARDEGDLAHRVPFRVREHLAHASQAIEEPAREPDSVLELWEAVVVRFRGDRMVEEPIPLVRHVQPGRP